VDVDLAGSHLICERGSHLGTIMSWDSKVSKSLWARMSLEHCVRHLSCSNRVWDSRCEL